MIYEGIDIIYGGCAMASDIWGFSITCFVLVCFFVAFTLTTENEEEIDDGCCIAFRVSIEII